MGNVHFSRLAGVRSMSTANGHGAVEPRCSCEREILLLRKELLDESRKNQALYGELAKQNRIVREFVTMYVFQSLSLVINTLFFSCSQS